MFSVIRQMLRKPRSKHAGCREEQQRRQMPERKRRIEQLEDRCLLCELGGRLEGYADLAQPKSEPVAERDPAERTRGGGTWAVSGSPNPSPYGDILTGVAAISATDAWAVGYT